MNLSIIAATLDPVTTKVESHNPCASNFAQTIVPTHTFDSAPRLDVLIVPGGLGNRSHDIVAVVEFIKSTYPSLRYFISICTGSGLAARAGILDGRRATTNKRAWVETIALGPRVKWVSHARWVVDGNIWTSSGVSAGIDATLAWIEAVYSEEEAKSVANGMEYTRHLDKNYDPFADLHKIPKTESM